MYLILTDALFMTQKMASKVLKKLHGKTLKKRGQRKAFKKMFIKYYT
jgi:hypothetical protein